MPAQPKANAVRPRSENPGLEWVDLPPEGNKKPPPHLPNPPQNLGTVWSDEARSMWIRLWQSPESTQWNREDTEAVYRYVVLHELGRLFDWTGPMLTAVAGFEEKFGISPAGKRKMYWRIRPTDEAATMSHLAPVKSIVREELR